MDDAFSAHPVLQLTKNVNLTLSFEDELYRSPVSSINIMVDPMKWSEVFDGLLIHSAQASPQGGTVTVTVTRMVRDELHILLGVGLEEVPWMVGDDWLRVDVHDEGVGLSAVRIRWKKQLENTYCALTGMFA